MTNTDYESEAKAIDVARMADDMKARDVRVLDVREVCNYTDYFVIASCTSSLQLRGVSKKIDTERRRADDHPFSVVGRDGSSWVVLDYGDVVVHLMSPETRDFYRLERIWKDARDVSWMESAGAASQSGRAADEEF